MGVGVVMLVETCVGFMGIVHRQEAWSLFPQRTISPVVGFSTVAVSFENHERYPASQICPNETSDL